MFKVSICLLDIIYKHNNNCKYVVPFLFKSGKHIISTSVIFIFDLENLSCHSCLHPFTDSFGRYLLSCYYVSDTLTDAGTVIVNQYMLSLLSQNSSSRVCVGRLTLVR